MAYSLANGRNELRQRLPWTLRKVEREPLVGLVDGSNTIFHLAHPPAVSGSVTVYDYSGNVLTPSSIDYESGRVVLASAPTQPCTASYQHTALTDGQWDGILRQGFDLMETLLPRGYYLVDSGGETYVSSDASSVVDPVIAGSTFSALPRQTELFLNCALVVYYESRLGEAAEAALSLRESQTGGLQIDRSRQYQAVQAALERALNRLADSLVAAAEEAGLEGTLFEGQGLPGARSDFHYYVMDWWRSGLQDMGVIS